MSFSSGQNRPKGDPHGWNGLEHYLNIHDVQLRRFSYFIEDDQLLTDLINEHTLRIRGRIRCAHGLFIDVTKTLEINERNQVRTIRYRYHAGVEGDRDRPIFRYDNAHSYQREGHSDEHHKHRYDHRTWQQITPPEWIGHDRWPTLAQVIDELEDWWNEIGCFLDLG